MPKVADAELHVASLEHAKSRKSDTTFGQGDHTRTFYTHIGREVALAARIAAFVYIYARISQIAEIHTSFYATCLPYLRRCSY